MSRGLAQAALLLASACLLPVAFGASAPSRPVWATPVAVARVPDAHINHELTTVDLNGDGLRDVVVGALVFRRIQPLPPIVFLNRGGGRFEDVSSSIFEGPPPAMEWSRQQVVADFNGDGRPDIFIADHGTDNREINPGLLGQQNRLVLSTPGGRLREATANLPQQRSFTHSASSADIDRDGDVDLFANNLSCCGRDRVPAQILVNDGTGRFAAAPERLRGLPRNEWGATYSFSTTFADVDGDGALDLVVGGDEQVERSAVLRNDGSGNFDFFATLPPKVYPPKIGIVMTIATTDVNRDGAPDLLLAETQNEPWYIGARVQVLVNDGRGGFTDETATRMPEQPMGRSWPNRILLEDLDDDGDADLALQLAPVGTVLEADPTPFWLNVDGVFRRIEGAQQGSPPQLRGPVGFVNGAGPHALVSIDSPTADGTVATMYVSTQLVRPAAPTPVRAESVRNAIRISWRTIPDATRYEVWRRAGRSAVRIGSTSRTAFADMRAHRGTAYRYTVRAVNAAGSGPFSQPVLGRRR